MSSSNPYPHLPSFTSNVFSPNYFFNHERTDFYFDPFDFHLHTYNSSPAEPQIIDNVLTDKQDSIVLQCNQNNDDLLDSVISPYKKKVATSLKKEGHSKIYTAQGPRDRRVRLSIDIARKFFCLQDLLGFDKASKTLDWLLTNSLIAIKELVEETKNCSSSTVTDESKIKFLETIENKGKKKKLAVRAKCVDGKNKKKMVKKCKGRVFQENNVTRDRSRAEARARARERTKEKGRVKKLDVGCESSSWCQFESQNDNKGSSFQISAFHYEQMSNDHN
ncbi:uncharacterized protein [Rutidosis leptorrhynchoides]|uniref:uncharacterized protein n=1 Tax=Rutidosis leptorrhynchoides TaxID=125765 RepID=UPI003A99D18C